MTGRRISLTDSLLLLIINLFWAASAAPAKIAVGGNPPAPGTFGPFQLAFLRITIGAVLMALALRSFHMPMRIARQDVGRFVLAAFFGIVVTYSVFYTGMRSTTASEGSLLFAAEPILIALIAWPTLHERLTRRQVIGMGAGFLGVYAIVCQGWVPRISGAVIGNAVVFASIIFESGASVIGKSLTTRYPGLQVVAVEFGIGALILLPLAGWETATSWNGWPGAPQIWSVVFLGTICSFFCYAIWFHLLPRIQISTMAGFLFIQPMLGPFYGRILLGETIGPWTIAGAALVLTGIYLVALGAMPSSIAKLTTRG